MFEEAGRYAWRDVPDPEITAPQQALVRPLLVACCDLDVAVAHGRAPLPPGHAVGHEGLAEVVAVGDAVTRSRSAIGWWCRFRSAVGPVGMPPRRDGLLRLGAVDGDVRAGPARRPRRRRIHVGSGAGAVRRRDAHPSSRSRSTRWPSPRCRTTSLTAGGRSAPYALRTGRPRSRRSTRPGGRHVCRSGCTRRHSRRRWARTSTTSTPTRVGWRRPRSSARQSTSRQAGQILGSVSRSPYTPSADPALLAATLRATWPDGVCTDTGIYYEQGRDAVAADVHPRRAVRHRPRQRARRHPGRPRTARRRAAICRRRSIASCLGGRTLGLADDDRQDRLHPGLAEA